MSSKIILVIDDDMSILETVDFLLTGEGYHVLLAPNGEDGLNIIKQQHIDIIILDLKMPKISGYMFANLVNKHSLNQNIKIMLLTAHSLFSGGCHISLPNVVTKISKPFETDLLLKTVQELTS